MSTHQRMLAAKWNLYAQACLDMRDTCLKRCSGNDEVIKLRAKSGQT